MGCLEKPTLKISKNEVESVRKKKIYLGNTNHKEYEWLN